MLHVHVEMPNIVNQNTGRVEPADTQGPVQKSTKEKKQSMLLQKTAKLILKPLKTAENTGYSLCARKPKVTANGLYLRKTNSVNYAPMLDSDADD